MPRTRLAVSSEIVIACVLSKVAPDAGLVIIVETMLLKFGIAPWTVDEQAPFRFWEPSEGARFGKFVAQKLIWFNCWLFNPLLLRFALLSGRFPSWALLICPPGGVSAGLVASPFWADANARQAIRMKMD